MSPNLLYDMHCHAYDLEDLEAIFEADKDIVIVAVSDDLESLLRVLELERMYPGRVYACAGFHPWSIRDGALHQVDTIVRLASREGLGCVGEVGLDRRFLGLETWSLQVRIFREFLRLAVDIGAFVNIHAPDAWSEALGELIGLSVERAMFHWYTGPQDLVEVIGEMGYKISINPAIKIQEKHARIAATTPLKYIVFESDAPYNYRGLKLAPPMIRESIALVAKLKNTTQNHVEEAAESNSRRLLIV
ncbi:MAG: TatD family hydrolase [Acidilobaceae archaeon]